MVSAAAPCASPNAMSAAAVARQPTSAGLVLRASLPRSRPAKRQAGPAAGGSPGRITFDSERAGIGSLPQPNSGGPEFGHDNWSKSETSEVEMGEGWGGGCLFDTADLTPPSRLAR